LLKCGISIFKGILRMEKNLVLGYRRMDEIPIGGNLLRVVGQVKADYRMGMVISLTVFTRKDFWLVNLMKVWEIPLL
jgi:hypothetical protein